MILASAARSLSDVLTPAFRSVLFKTLAISILALAVIWAAGTRLIAMLAAWFATAYPVDYPWYVDAFTTAASILSGVLLFVGLAFLVAPVSAVVAGFFLDDIAGTVERTHYPSDPPGRPLPLITSIGETVKFTVAVVGVNLVALLLLLVPGVNLVAFFAGNGYLLGREYFQMAAFRLMPKADAEALRRQNKFRVFLAGVVVAGFLAVPGLNLLTPLFATALMVHLVKAVTGSRPQG